MSKSIKINYIWDKDLAIESSYDIYQYELKNSNRRFIGWFLIGLTQFGIVGALKHNAYGILFISTIALFYWYILRWPIRKFLIQRSFKNSNFLNETISLEITNNAILSNNKVQVSLDSISKTLILTNGIVLYHNLGTIYIPNKAFKTIKDKNLFKSLL